MKLSMQGIYNEKVDQYAYAITVLETTTGRPPWYERNLRVFGYVAGTITMAFH